MMVKGVKFFSGEISIEFTRSTFMMKYSQNFQKVHLSEQPYTIRLFPVPGISLCQVITAITISTTSSSAGISTTSVSTTRVAAAGSSARVSTVSSSTRVAAASGA